MDKMDTQQLEDISNEIQSLHKPMKNIIEIVFAASPLLALSTHGWASQTLHSTYLLRVMLFFRFLDFIDAFQDVPGSR